MSRYLLIGPTADGLLLFLDRLYPSDAPQIISNITPDQAARMHSTQFDKGRYFAVSEVHARVRGLIPSNPTPAQE